jgi:hypothetical protein
MANDLRGPSIKIKDALCWMFCYSFKYVAYSNMKVLYDIRWDVSLWDFLKKMENNNIVTTCNHF